MALDPTSYDRLFGSEGAFDHSVTRTISLAVAAVLVATPIVILLLSVIGVIGRQQRADLWKRYVSWLLLVPLIVGPILLGAAWMMGAFAALVVLCYREYARATGLFREKAVSGAVVVGILAVLFAVADHWYALFVALPSLVLVLIAVVGVAGDRPSGYIQRVALGVLGFILFGFCLGHLGYLANDAHFRPMTLFLFLIVEMNDVFGYVCGKTLGRGKLAPATSPGKTAAGAVGAIVLTSALTILVGRYLFLGTDLEHPLALAFLGALLSIAGQFGDLMLSAIKRDIGIKDMGNVFPGHGGLLDRFDSMILVAPVFFHYVGYFQGIGLDQPARIITGQ